ncbi:dsDNA nuclease domain-containing protein [Vibrio parahaemolyticus]|nr:dsDNA nuclease domain-containing protein [Vibrio parahaemolyticus]MDF4671496.1 dsDNA nuclease domain-containing protein [Vibrio parahaemolyticus]HAV1411523.1 DUF4297 domain-containing protein [Vibrio parahaemolyticus]HAV1416034.1 DUF4297 domain-containing protein [Vibrio parahaemolyticus]HAV2005393.1 DUF4297 domain-containing protein [Vibrio parahaemolyticus]
MSQSDSGGVGAKKGFLYQDYVATYYALKMLQDKNLLSVRCEVTDDIDLVYSHCTEYVQVKTTQKDKSWQLTEFTERSYKIPTGKKRKVFKEDSILHKSLDCDNDTNVTGRFRIVTPREICSKLSYLKVPLSERADKISERDALLKSLQNQLKLYTSPVGHDVEYWLDNAVWEVLPSIEQLKLASCRIITNVAYEHCGVHLNPISDPNNILDRLLVNIVEKSATSNVLHSSDQKTYFRQDLLDWFNNEVEICAQHAQVHTKVYSTNRSQLKAILKAFLSKVGYSQHNGEKKCVGLEGEYYRNQYQYQDIANGISSWLQEVILRPSELVDHSTSMPERIKTYTQRKTAQMSDLDKLIARVLLHSTVRTSSKAQPIPAVLYFDDADQTQFDNVHILLNQDQPDQLLLGFSQTLVKNHLDELDTIVSNFDYLLRSDIFKAHNERILEVKEDGYLLKHDLDEILSSEARLDDNLSRFKFVFFIGYETNHLCCNKKLLSDDYETKLESEVLEKFESLVNKLIDKDEYFEDLDVQVYLYPVPSLTNLRDVVATI